VIMDQIDTGDIKDIVDNATRNDSSLEDGDREKDDPSVSDKENKIITSVVTGAMSVFTTTIAAASATPVGVAIAAAAIAVATAVATAVTVYQLIWE
jgi:lysozyme family protein